MRGSDDEGFPRAQKQLAEDEVLMKHYSELREEIREQSKEIRTRESRSIAAIAVIAGYAFYADDGLILISLIPVVLAITFIAHVGTSIWLSRLACHIVHIQESVDVDKFCWEKDYGMYAAGQSADLIPIAAFYLIGSSVYAVSVIVSLRIIRDPDAGLLGYRPDPLLLFLFYLALAVLMLASAAAFFYDFRQNVSGMN